MGGRLAFVTFLSGWLFAVVAAPARADVDATGRWVIHATYALEPIVAENWTQSGTSLTTSSGYAGTIDPVNGNFGMSRAVPICGLENRGGTVAPDGLTMSGFGLRRPGLSPGSCFMGVPYTFTGSRCPSGTIEPGEECDDGNDIDDDGCSALCEIEACSTCTGEPSSCSALPAPCCGNGLIEPGEQCDDDNDIDFDGCLATCEIENCWFCSGEPSSCSFSESSCCGDGNLQSGEECDDLNRANGDGCNTACEIEECWACPGACVPAPEGMPCYDGEVCTNEACDGAGSCASTPAAAGSFCTDGEVCTNDGCDGAGSCASTPSAQGSACTDGDACTNEECDGAGSCEVTSPVDCDDANFCTFDSCNPGPGCIHQPDVRSCREAAKTSLLAVDDDGDGDRLIWKWIRGEDTPLEYYADPLSTAAYELCIFAGPAYETVAQARIDPDAQKWEAIGEKGYRYSDSTGTADGIQKMLLRVSEEGNRSKIILKGKGPNLPAIHPPLDLPVTLQFRNTETDICWGGVFDAADPNRTGKFKAKTTVP